MTTYSSVLAWRIPGMGEPGGLPSMGSHRVRHDWSDLAAAAATWMDLGNVILSKVRERKTNIIWYHLCVESNFFKNDTNKLIYKRETDFWISKTSLWLPLEKCWGKDTLGAWDKHTQLSCLTLFDSMDCSPTGSSVHEIFQARILEWVAISRSRGSSKPRDWTHFSCVSTIDSGFFTSALPGKPTYTITMYNSDNQKQPTI